MASVDIPELSRGGRDQRREERDESLGAERSQRMPDSMHDRQGIESVGPGGVKGAFHDACEHGGRHAVAADIRDEQRRLA